MGDTETGPHKEGPSKVSAAARRAKTEAKDTPHGRAERLLHVAAAPRKDSARWGQLDPLTWDDFLVWLDLENPADHRECGAYVGGLLRGGRRQREAVESRSVLTLDADKAGPSFLDDVARVLPGVAVAVHATWRHGVEGSRYRLLAPLSRPLDGDRYRRVAEAVRDTLGQHWGGDKGCPEPERFMYRPSSQGHYAHHVFPGRPLDVEAWLAPQLHPYAAKAIEAELARLDECSLLGWGGPGWNTTTFEVACVLVEFANSPWSGYTPERAEADLMGRAPTDEGFGPVEHEEIWAGVLERLGDKSRPEPDDAADDFAEPVVDLAPRRSDGEDWLVNMVLPARSYGVLDGPIGAGKSSILGHIVHRVTGKGFRVRYCVEDEPMSTARHRLELLGTDMSLVELDEVPDLTTPEVTAQYAANCRSAGVDLVLFDLLASANSAYEENRPEKVKNWTKQLVEQFCSRHGMSVLGTHHWNNNSKAGSALARQSGGGALSAKAEFHWSVAMSNDRTEQVWTVHARRKVPVQQNRWMKGTPHFVEVLEDEYEPGAKQELHVYTVDYEANAGDRTAKDVADEAAREYAEGRKRSSKDVVAEQADVLHRFLLGQPRKRPEVDQFLYWLSGVEYGPQTVVDRLRDVGAIQCTDKGEPMERGKFWTVER
jgi:hypothetical protein